MQLLIFDIDGTIVDSVKTDDQCFIQAFLDLYQIDLLGADWNDFKHVTDSGLTQEIFEIHLGRSPTETEIDTLKSHFYHLLSQCDIPITEIKGAKDVLTDLMEDSGTSIAFATGGWKETALLKFSAIDFDPDGLIFTSANDHFDRSVITKLAIEKSLRKEQLTSFDSITYIGDGLWDFRTTQALEINFIGVDHQLNHKLRNAGAMNVVSDLMNLEKIIGCTKL